MPVPYNPEFKKGGSGSGASGEYNTYALAIYETAEEAKEALQVRVGVGVGKGERGGKRQEKLQHRA